MPTMTDCRTCPHMGKSITGDWACDLQTSPRRRINGERIIGWLTWCGMMKGCPIKKKVMTMTIDEIRQRMCDNYCKYPGDALVLRESMDLICDACPLNELDRYKEGDEYDGN